MQAGTVAHPRVLRGRRSAGARRRPNPGAARKPSPHLRAVRIHPRPPLTARTGDAEAGCTITSAGNRPPAEAGAWSRAALCMHLLQSAAFAYVQPLTNRCTKFVMHVSWCWPSFESSGPHSCTQCRAGYRVRASGFATFGPRPVSVAGGSSRHEIPSEMQCCNIATLAFGLQHPAVWCGTFGAQVPVPHARTHAWCVVLTSPCTVLRRLPPASGDRQRQSSGWCVRASRRQEDTLSARAHREDQPIHPCIRHLFHT